MADNQSPLNSPGKIVNGRWDVRYGNEKGYLAIPIGSLLRQYDMTEHAGRHVLAHHAYTFLPSIPDKTHPRWYRTTLRRSKMDMSTRRGRRELANCPRTDEKGQSHEVYHSANDAVLCRCSTSLGSFFKLGSRPQPACSSVIR